MLVIKNYCKLTIMKPVFVEPEIVVTGKFSNAVFCREVAGSDQLDRGRARQWTVENKFLHWHVLLGVESHCHKSNLRDGYFHIILQLLVTTYDRILQFTIYRR